MRCSTLCALSIVIATVIATGARAETRLITAAVVAEPGQAAPAVSMRTISANGNMWDIGISGWTLSAGIERPIERGLRVIGSVAATPYNANSSTRIYEGGDRATALEYDAASYSARGGVRIRHNERSITELQLLVGHDVIGDDAPRTLSDDWDTPYAGAIGMHRYRRITAEDPFTMRIEGLDVTMRAETYGGAGRSWSRVTVSQTAGRTFGGTHLQQSTMLLAGANLDRVSSFLLGGSWDALGPEAIYGRRYAEYRVTRGVIANGAADRALNERWTLGGRVSAFRAPDITSYGAALQTNVRARGLRITAGVAVPFGGSGEHPVMLYGSVATAIFR